MHQLPAAVLALLLLSALSVHAQEHTIKMDRLPKAGTVFEVSAQTEQSGDLKTVLSKLRRWGVTGTYKASAAVVARVTVEEVDAQGWATKANLKVIRFDVAGERKGSANPTGKTFALSMLQGRRVYLEPTGVAGERYVLDEPMAGILDLALPLRFLKGETGLDAMFAPDAAKKVGATWNANPQGIAAAFAHWTATKEGSEGKTILKSATANAMTVDSTLTVTNIRFPYTTFNVPADYTFTDSKGIIQITTTLPAEASALPTAQTIKVSLTVSGTLKGKKESEWDKGSGQVKYKLVK